MEYRKIILVLFLLFSLPQLDTLQGAEGSEGEGGRNFLNIRKYYYKWDQGFDGSRGYFRKILYSYMVEMIGREITTDYDYIPEYADDKTHESRFRFGEWLVVSGTPSAENLKEIEAFRLKYGRNSQPGKGLFSISGRIRKFRLSEYSEKRRIHIHLDDMRIKSADVKVE